MDYQSFVNGDKTVLIAPAGYGKTYTIVECLKYTRGKQLILTHTHAGVASIKSKLQESKNREINCNVETISSFAQKYVNHFYYGVDVPLPEDANNYHSFMLKKLFEILKSNIVQLIIQSSYSGLFVDEYQDCSKSQHQIIMLLSDIIPTHLLGDPLQGIFNFNDDLVDMTLDLIHFDKHSDLSVPQRWFNCKKYELGNALKDVRDLLQQNKAINLNHYSKSIQTYQINEADKYQSGSNYYKQIKKLSGEDDILIIDPVSNSINSRVKFIQLFKEYKLIESIDDKDFYNLAKKCDHFIDNSSDDNLFNILSILFNKTGLKYWFNEHGFKKKKDSDEQNEIFKIRQLYADKISLKKILIATKKLKEIKCYRISLFNSLLKAIDLANEKSTSIYDGMVEQRNILRRSGRKISGKCIGTTLLTKGLEFNTVVILDAHKFMCPKNLYVAMTRCKNELIIFTKHMVLEPYN